MSAATPDSITNCRVAIRMGQTNPPYPRKNHGAYAGTHVRGGLACGRFAMTANPHDAEFRGWQNSYATSLRSPLMANTDHSRPGMDRACQKRPTSELFWGFLACIAIS